MGLKLLANVRNPGETEASLLQFNMDDNSITSVKDLKAKLLGKLHDRFDPALLRTSCKGCLEVEVTDSNLLDFSSAALTEEADGNIRLYSTTKHTTDLWSSAQLRAIAFDQVLLVVVQYKHFHGQIFEFASVPYFHFISNAA